MRCRSCAAGVLTLIFCQRSAVNCVDFERHEWMSIRRRVPADATHDDEEEVSSEEAPAATSRIADARSRTPSRSRETSQSATTPARSGESRRQSKRLSGGLLSPQPSVQSPSTGVRTRSKQYI